MKNVSNSAFDKINTIENLRNYVFKTSTMHCEDYRASYFSDCLVISVPHNSEGSLHNVLYDIADLSIMLLQEGIIVRGGVTAGPVIHMINAITPLNDIIIGPAMNRAVELEKNAVFPKVLVDDVIVEMAEIDTWSCKKLLKQRVNETSTYVDFISCCKASYKQITNQKLEEFCKSEFDLLKAPSLKVSKYWHWL